MSCWLNIPSGLLVQKGYGFCGVITYHLMSLPAQGKAWSSCNERQALEKKETKQNPWIKTVCIFSVPHSDQIFAFNLLAFGQRAWQRQRHNYILIKSNEVGRWFYCLIVPNCWSASLLHRTISSREREEKENAEEERDKNKRNCFWQPVAFSWVTICVVWWGKTQLAF